MDVRYRHGWGQLTDLPFLPSRRNLENGKPETEPLWWLAAVVEYIDHHVQHMDKQLLQLFFRGMLQTQWH